MLYVTINKAFWIFLGSNKQKAFFLFFAKKFNSGHTVSNVMHSTDFWQVPSLYCITEQSETDQCRKCISLTTAAVYETGNTIYSNLLLMIHFNCLSDMRDHRNVWEGHGCIQRLPIIDIFTLSKSWVLVEFWLIEPNYSTYEIKLCGKMTGRQK